MFEAYLDVLKATGKTKNTIEGYRYQLTKFFDWLQATEDTQEIADITTPIVRAYRDALIAEGMKRRSINTALTALNAFCSWMTFEGYFDHNPVSAVERLRGPQEPPRWLNENDRYRVIRAALLEANKRNTVIVLTFLLAGLTVSELVQLTPDDVLIDKGKGYIAVRTGKRRVVPMPKDLRRLMAQYTVQQRATAALLFDSQRGEQLTEKGAQLVCIEVGDKANVPALTPSVLRNTLAHDLVSKGVPLKHVAVLLGVSVKQMEKYRDTVLAGLS